MRAEIITIGASGERVIVSKIGKDEFCLEIHRGGAGGFANMHVIVTREELSELAAATHALLEAGQDPRRGP